VPEERVRVAYVAGALGDGGGMARYARELLRALDRRDDVEVVVVIPSAAASSLPDVATRVIADIVAFHGTGPIGRALWERQRLGRVLERLDVDVVHGMKHILPRTRLPTVLTVHDVMPLSRREQFGLAKRLLLPRQYLASIKGADVLLCVSAATARRIVEIDASLGDRIIVSHLGVASALQTAEPHPPATAPNEPFALVVGDLSPRKNMAFLLDIWSDVESATGGLRLLAVGPDGWKSSATRARLTAASSRGEAVWAKHVDDSELRWCYEHAAVVLMPTLEEGFGLPVLEALALGSPVVASTDPALVEASQGRAHHVDVRSRDAWIKAIAATLAAPRPAPVSDLPTWDQCAATTMAAYRAAIARHDAHR
jgi:glycosyltransferase involved in cell wall biosynthesis